MCARKKNANAEEESEWHGELTAPKSKLASLRQIIMTECEISKTRGYAVVQNVSPHLRSVRISMLNAVAKPAATVQEW